MGLACLGSSAYAVQDITVGEWLDVVWIAGNILVGSGLLQYQGGALRRYSGVTGTITSGLRLRELNMTSKWDQATWKTTGD